MSNQYGLDFLRTEHTLNNEGQPHAGAAAAAAAAVPSDTLSSSWDGDTIQLAQAARSKPNLQKFDDVLQFLKRNRSGGALFAHHIFQRTGIDLEVENEVVQMIEGSDRVQVEQIPDPENPSIMMATYAYQSRFPTVRDRTSLLALIIRQKVGVSDKDLEDSYDNVINDISALITAGDVIAVYNAEDRKKVLFPRGEKFLVELDGNISLPPAASAVVSTTQGSSAQLRPLDYIGTDIDPTTQIRRGEAIQIGGTWFRVDSKTKEGTLKDQQAGARAPESVTSREDLSVANSKFIRKFSETSIPVDHTIPPTAMQNIQKAVDARARLSKASHAKSHGKFSVAKILTGSEAYAENPLSLANQVGTQSSIRPNKRPTASKLKGTEQQQQELDAAKKAAEDHNLHSYSHARRHGCTMDIRSLYLSTKDKVPKDENDLKEMLVQSDLLDPKEEMRSPRELKRKSEKDNDGKKVKRRYYERKGQRYTNTHLEGHRIGAILQRAWERVRQGEEVGDGGM